MRPKIITQTNTGISNPVVLDYSDSNYQVGLQAVITSGTPTYTVEYTLDPILDPAFAAAGYTASWFPTSGMNAVTTSTTSNYAVPVYACRLNVTGTGVVRLTVLQTNR